MQYPTYTHRQLQLILRELRVLKGLPINLNSTNGQLLKAYRDICLESYKQPTHNALIDMAIVRDIENSYSIEEIDNLAFNLPEHIWSRHLQLLFSPRITTKYFKQRFTIFAMQFSSLNYALLGTNSDIVTNMINISLDHPWYSAHTYSECDRNNEYRCITGLKHEIIIPVSCLHSQLLPNLLPIAFPHSLESYLKEKVRGNFDDRQAILIGFMSEKSMEAINQYWYNLTT